jgi:hypothetical protein
MVAYAVKNFSQKILVVGSIYDRIELLQNNQKLLDEHDLIIINGNICYPNDKLARIENNIDVVNDLMKSGKMIYNLGNQDLLLMKELEETNRNFNIVKWLKSKSNVIMIEFVSQYNLIITNGGITPKMKKNDLYDNLETSFVSNIENKPWHHWYGGGYGYVISNNPLTQMEPKFYNFSLQLGNEYSSKNTFAIQIGQYGVGQTFLL